VPKRLTPVDLTIGDRIRARRQLRGWSLRYAADRCGIHHATLSRIERGLASADNRFVLADIAAGLECPVAELTGQPAASADAKIVAARASVAAVRQALIEADFTIPLTGPSTSASRPMPRLEQEAELVRALQTDLNYAGAGQYLPRLIRDLHAAASGPDRTTALRLAVLIGDVAVALAKTTGYPADAWLAGDWAWQAAEALDDPVLLAFAAYSRAQAATGCGAYERGRVLATGAVDELQGSLGAADALPMLGMLLLISAHTAYATKRKGDGADTYAEAERVAARTGETTALRQYFGPTNVAFWRLGSEVDGGDLDRAVRIAYTTTRTYSPSRSGG
jgi:transcriptional regulator with XRE-family HTH domain